MADGQVISLPLELRKLLAGLQSAEVPDTQQWIITLLRHEGQQIITLLWRMLGSEPDVLDAYQTAVCQMTGRGHEAATTNLGGYFYRTAMNAAIGILRNRKQRREQWSAVVDVQARRDAGREPASPDQILDQRQTLDRMRHAIYQLPPHLREVILLRDLGQLPYNKVASMLSIRCVTARIYRRQAVIRLAEIMGQEVAG